MSDDLPEEDNLSDTHDNGTTTLGYHVPTLIASYVLGHLGGSKAPEVLEAGSEQ